jgi:protein-S-isoprenylcysteine O-methyltransferase Ste14
MSLPWSLLPLLHACVFGLVAVVARIVLVHRRSGVLPIAFGGADSARDLTARCFYAWLPLADLAFLVVYALRDDPGPLLWPATPWMDAVHSIGAGLLAVALVWVALAQAAMGTSWRMGVDDGGEGVLLTSGLFARSRHPVYTGIRATLFAQLLLIFSWPMLCLWLSAELLVQLQARFEEEAMEARYGALYRDYRAAVRRWL